MDFTMMPMDDFKVILGHYFQRGNMVIPILWMDQFIVLGDGEIWVVCTTT